MIQLRFVTEYNIMIVKELRRHTRRKRTNRKFVYDDAIAAVITRRAVMAVQAAFESPPTEDGFMRGGAGKKCPG